MWEDPIVKEIHEHRKAQLERFDGDIKAYVKYIRKKKKTSTREVFRAPKKKKID